MVDIAISAPARSIEAHATSISRLRMTWRIGTLWTRTSYIDSSSESGSIPWDIVRLPCGSMSTHRTRWPSSAKAAARFSVVVVLATPPFWLANAMTFALCSTEMLAPNGLLTGRSFHAPCGSPFSPMVVHWDDVGWERVDCGELRWERRRLAPGLSRFRAEAGARIMPVHVHVDEEEIVV